MWRLMISLLGLLYSVQNLLSSHLLFKNLNIKLFGALRTLPGVVYECESWSLTQAEGFRGKCAEEGIWGQAGRK